MTGEIWCLSNQVFYNLIFDTEWPKTDLCLTVNYCAWICSEIRPQGVHQQGGTSLLWFNLDQSLTDTAINQSLKRHWKSFNGEHKYPLKIYGKFSFQCLNHVTNNNLKEHPSPSSSCEILMSRVCYHSYADDCLICSCPLKICVTVWCRFHSTPRRFPYRTFSLGTFPSFLMARHSSLCSSQHAVWQVRSQ